MVEQSGEVVYTPAMDQVVAALEHVRAIQTQLLAKEREMHAAIRAGEGETIRKLQMELTELFARSEAAFQALNRAFDSAGLATGKDTKNRP
jgi:hypothetical protein